MRPGSKYVAEQDPDSRLAISFVHFTLHEVGSPNDPIYQNLPREVHYIDPLIIDTILGRIIDYSNPIERDLNAPQKILIAERLLEGVLMDLAHLSKQEELYQLPVPVQYIAKLRHIIASIREDPSYDWSIEEMSTGIHVSSDHFSRLFKRLTGNMPKEFLINARMERARALLQEQNLPVSEVAELLGYSSIYYFSRQVKSHTGFTPSELKQKRLG
jgi:AraC-like DNA-binding protein